MCDQLRLPCDHAIEQRPVWLLRLCGLRVVPGDRIVRQPARPFRVALGGEILEGAHAQVARRYPGQHGSRQDCFAQHPFPRGHRGQGPGGRHAQRRHGLAHDVLAQDRTERGSAVAAAGEGGGAGALELDVVAHAVTPHHLAQQVGAAVAELRHEMPELVPGIGQRQRLGPLGHAVAGQNLHSLRARQRVRIQPQVARQFHIQLDQARGRYRCRVHPSVEVLRQPRIGVFETETDGMVAGFWCDCGSVW